MKRRGSRYRDDWGSDVNPEDLAVRVHPKNGSLGVVKGAGHVDPRAKPIQTIADVERVLQIPSIHVTRAERRGRELEQRRRSSGIDDHRVRKALGVRAPVTVGDDQPDNAVTIHQILALPNAAIGGRRIDHKALRKDWQRAMRRANGQQQRHDARAAAKKRDADDAKMFGMAPVGEAWRSLGDDFRELFRRLVAAFKRPR